MALPQIGLNAIGSNLTLGSQSPVFTYLPARDGSVNNGWNASYTGTTHAEAYGGGVGVGTAYRETQMDGASVGLSYNGTSVYFCLGLSSYPASFQLTVDGITGAYTIQQSSDPACDGYEGADSVVLVNNLQDGAHEVSLSVSVDQPGYVRFYGAVVTLIGGSTEQVLKRTNISWADKSWIYEPTGVWGNRPDYDLFNNSLAIGDLEGSSRWARTYDPTSIAEISITDTSVFYLLGPIGPKFANYTVSFSGASQTFIPTNYFAAYQQVLYFAGWLDPTLAYTLTLQNWDEQNPAQTSAMYLAIDALVLMKPVAASEYRHPRVRNQVPHMCSRGPTYPDSHIYFIPLHPHIASTRNSRWSSGRPGTPHRASSTPDALTSEAMEDATRSRRRRSTFATRPFSILPNPNQSLQVLEAYITQRHIYLIVSTPAPEAGSDHLHAEPRPPNIDRFCHLYLAPVHSDREGSSFLFGAEPGHTSNEDHITNDVEDTNYAAGSKQLAP
ncbi:hypothetical protein DACRYDRAFT_107246 [Dacryopinax primogenitus]|uniref:Uncharacterized protein n=1 Tax=Dacryopinax primogenitus (strain DJM 731) TaxID=1858805 RepID=M5FWJ9_DACPD|nr:uncharacterized protein DACRYDRAFT_107246 [Dacryopinax primogenitus]EJU02316.1 hypothetical protein DACRYDRAFT_107246 [Dacryopinax primogenitus]